MTEPSLSSIALQYYLPIEDLQYALPQLPQLINNEILHLDKLLPLPSRDRFWMHMLHHGAFTNVTYVVRPHTTDAERTLKRYCTPLSIDSQSHVAYSNSSLNCLFPMAALTNNRKTDLLKALTKEKSIDSDRVVKVDRKILASVYCEELERVSHGDFSMFLAPNGVDILQRLIDNEILIDGQASLKVAHSYGSRWSELKKTWTVKLSEQDEEALLYALEVFHCRGDKRISRGNLLELMDMKAAMDGPGIEWAPPPDYSWLDDNAFQDLIKHGILLADTDYRLRTLADLDKIQPKEARRLIEQRCAYFIARQRLLEQINSGSDRLSIDLPEDPHKELLQALEPFI